MSEIHETRAVASAFASMCGVTDRFSIRFLQQLFVSDRYQRRGVGTRLLENGLELIKQVDLEKRSEDTSDTLDYDIALTSSPQGKLLYERHGFKDVYWFNPHFDDIDEKGNEIKKDVRWPLMIQQ